MALETTVVAIGILQKGATLPKYPERPYSNKEESNQMDEKQLEKERARAYVSFTNMLSSISRKR